MRSTKEIMICAQLMFEHVMETQFRKTCKELSVLTARHLAEYLFHKVVYCTQGKTLANLRLANE